SSVAALGRSLLHAARALFARGYGAVGLLNADSPTLPAELMVEAARLLAQPGERAVLGPATDGGYYFIGLKAPHAELFVGIEWSSARVAAQTRAAAQRIGLALAEIAPWYDIDDPASLAQLVRECDENGDVAPATAAWLQRQGVARRLASAASEHSAGARG